MVSPGQVKSAEGRDGHGESRDPKWLPYCGEGRSSAGMKSGEKRGTN